MKTPFNFILYIKIILYASKINEYHAHHNVEGQAWRSG